MSPDDTRHGQYAGAVTHWLEGERPCGDCAKAEWRYRKLRKLDALRGQPRSVRAIGTLRRIQALNALGYASTRIADEAGLSVATLRSISYHDPQTIHRTTADAVTTAYERLCMTRPEGGYAHRARNMARRKGWLPPLAWDDIDHDPEPVTNDPINAIRTGVDPVVVWRVLNGDTATASCATAAERRQIAVRWAESGQSLASLARITGWKPERYWKASA